jgi:tRNA (pseudouridine54-N1)-methyltransferase
MTTSECDWVKRKFAIIGHKAPSSGNLSLNDLTGLSGRMDVLVRAINAALFISHGIRKNSQIVLHLMGGNDRSRRVMFDGATVTGVRSDERSIAGHIKSILKLRLPPIGHWEEVSTGVFHSSGGILETVLEWERDDVNISILDIDGPNLNYNNLNLSNQTMGFILSDDSPFTINEISILSKFKKIKLGDTWLQGHSCITIVHHIIDSKIIS